MSCYKLAWIAGLALAVLIGGLPRFEAADAQEIPKVAYRNLRRAKLFTGLANTGMERWF